MKLVLVTFLMLAGSADGQNPRRTGGHQTVNAGAFNLPAVTFHGELKEITSKEIVLDGEDGHAVTIYRNRKTRFLRDKNPIDPKQIAPGTKLTLDVAENPDGTLLAVNVIITK